MTRRSLWARRAGIRPRVNRALHDAVWTLTGRPGSREAQHFALRAAAREFDIVGFEADGLSWLGATGDHITAELLRAGGYQAAEIVALDRWLRAGGRGAKTIVEVGANIGSTTLPFARLGWSVVALEPVPLAHELLTMNVTRNGFSQSVRTKQCAVSTTAASVTMGLFGDLGHSEIVSEGRTSGFGEAPAATATVRAAPLSQLLVEFDLDPATVAMVWTDTQGHETEVLKSGLPLWHNGVPCFAEIWPRGLRAHGGVDEFLAIIGECFHSFAACEELTAPGTAIDFRPISDFPRFIRDLEERDPGICGPYSDALLVP